MGTSGLWLVTQNPGDSRDVGLAWGGRCWGTDSGPVGLTVSPGRWYGVEVDCRSPGGLGGLPGGAGSPSWDACRGTMPYGFHKRAESVLTLSYHSGQLIPLKSVFGRFPSPQNSGNCSCVLGPLYPFPIPAPGMLCKRNQAASLLGLSTVCAVVRTGSPSFSPTAMPHTCPFSLHWGEFGSSAGLGDDE